MINRQSPSATGASPTPDLHRSATLSRVIRIDVARLVERLDALGEIGAVIGPHGERGCARLALTDADRDGRNLVVGWMRDLGLHVKIDVVGNVFATRPGVRSDLPR